MAAGAAHILIVEDHDDTCRLLGKVLQVSGYDVTCCGNLAQARDAANKHRFDVVVSDIGLPDGSGLDLMRDLRDSQHLTGIALSGFGTAHDLQQSREAGFATHLIKPVDVSRLRNAIAQILTDHAGL